MLYRIARLIDENTGEVDFEYVFGKRMLGKACYEIIHNDEWGILEITPLIWTWKTFKKCFTHTISISIE